MPETSKAGMNTFLAVTGVFLIFPWFFMDMTDSEKIEIKAYKERYMELDKLGGVKDCGKTRDGGIM
jgi:hypothetical protein